MCGDGVHCETVEISINWSSFKDWLYRTYNSKTAYDYFNYSRQYYWCLLNKDLSELFKLSNSKRRHVIKALSSLSKFLGMHEDFLRLVKNYGLKWSVQNDDLIIARFSKTVDPNEVFDWIRKVKTVLPELSDFLDFMAVTGMRFLEALASYNLIIKLAREGRLSEYYDPEKEILEHYKFKELFLRKTKKVFISFVPRELVEKISLNEGLTFDSIFKKVQRHIGKMKFSDIRELHGTLLTRYLNEAEINFIHGRISSSVFMRNYFNPIWITDLKERAMKGIEEIKSRLS